MTLYTFLFSACECKTHRAWDPKEWSYTSSLLKKLSINRSCRTNNHNFSTKKAILLGDLNSRRNRESSVILCVPTYSIIIGTSTTSYMQASLWYSIKYFTD